MRSVVGRRTRTAAAAVAVSLLPTPASAVDDTTPPVVDSVTFQPTTPTVHSAIAFAATAHDTESGIASLTWTFGDGGSAVGPSVSHTYAQSGTMTVTVTAVDLAGNTATATAAVPVSAFQPEPSYTEPTVSRLEVRPATISLEGRTAGVRRRASVSFRLSDIDDTTRLSVEVRGTTARTRFIFDAVDDGGDHVLRLSTLPGARSGLGLLPGRYRVIVRAANRYGVAKARAPLRIVR
ncbi:PKD domain-containing protein [Nocardioides KLBMP 9356]|uniref:PKD domain-containing protein n=1 Tax=Nocardioides potassii TaxID=2911371 RepID=A0ABS9H8C4_9ACTN|nr:PKD domain-containing protein [Nocardioides potassii]MCF6376734.1 PKD domain-containing protein [Nocardioides potassii]